MVCVRREDPHIRHRRLEIHVVDMGVIGPGQPLQLRQELIGNEPPELVPERTAAAVVGWVLRVPPMLDHGDGGHIVAQGKLKDILASKDSITGQYLSGVRRIAIPAKRHPMQADQCIKLIGASGNNLQDVTIEIPCGLMTCVTGVSGSGKKPKRRVSVSGGGRQQHCRDFSVFAGRIYQSWAASRLLRAPRRSGG